MRCTCCGEEADTVLETPDSGVSFLCGDCSDACFSMLSETWAHEADATANP